MPDPPTRRAKSLLGYLLLHRNRRISRECLVDVLWPGWEPTRGRKALRTCLWRLRGALDAAGTPEQESMVMRDGQLVGLRLGADAFIDVEAFDAGLKDIEHEDPTRMDEVRVRQIEEALRLYRGPLLEHLYDEWCQVEAERCRLRWLHGMEFMMVQNMATQQWEAAIACGQAILQMDPLREHVHQRIMLCHHRRGDRGLAIRQYEACVDVLWRELAIRPMESMRRLYDTIRFFGQR